MMHVVISSSTTRRTLMICLHQVMLCINIVFGLVCRVLFQAVFNDELLLGWGWQLVGDTPVPVFVTKNIISKDMRELSRCGCKINCKGNCGCKRDPVQPCTRLCGCRGNCKSDDKTLRATQPVRKENTQ